MLAVSAILRTGKTGSFETEFWIDRERGSAVVKVINNPDSESVHGITEIKYLETPQGWLVSGWTYLEFHVPASFHGEIAIERVTRTPDQREQFHHPANARHVYPGSH